MAAKKPNWSKLETTLGTAEDVPELLAALSSSSKQKRRAALSELSLLLVEHGDRSEAAVFVIPELAARLGRSNSEDRLALLELLSWLAASEPGAACAAHLVPVHDGDGWHRVGETNTLAYLAVEAHSKEVAAALSDRDPAVRGAALGVLCLAPPKSAALLLPALEDTVPALAALAALALVKQARYWGVALDDRALVGKPKGAAALLLASARLLHEDGAAAWSTLMGQLEKLKKLAAPEKDTRMLPQALRGSGLVAFCFAILARSAAADHARLARLLARAPQAVDEDTLVLLAEALFSREDVTLRGARPERLSESQRAFVALLANTDPFTSTPHEAVIARGVPISPLDGMTSSFARAAESYLGKSPADAYRKALPGVVRGKQVRWPLYVWAHGVVRSEVPESAFVAAVAGLSTKALLSLAEALSFPPRDLVGPGFDQRILHHALTKATAKDKSVAAAARKRADAERPEGATGLWLWCQAVNPKKPSEEELTELEDRVCVLLYPGADALVREVLASLPAPAAARVVESLDLDDLSSCDPVDLLSRWEVLELSADPKAAASEAVSAIRDFDDPPRHPTHTARAGRALSALMPHSRTVVAKALKARTTAPWDPFLRSWLATTSRS